jgi:hypothetical protein
VRRRKLLLRSVLRLHVCLFLLASRDRELWGRAALAGATRWSPGGAPPAKKAAVKPLSGAAPASAGCAFGATWLYLL